MGFWGWPLEQQDGVERAYRAAASIRNEFARLATSDLDAKETKRQLLSDFRIGIGMSTGRAVAGRIGTTDQEKVTAFGPVVNVAARLESLTRDYGTEILVDEATAAKLRSTLDEAAAVIRRLGEIRPYGMTTNVTIYESIRTQVG